MPARILARQRIACDPASALRCPASVRFLRRVSNSTSRKNSMRSGFGSPATRKPSFAIWISTSQRSRSRSAREQAFSIFGHNTLGGGRGIINIRLSCLTKGGATQMYPALCNFREPCIRGSSLLRPLASPHPPSSALKPDPQTSASASASLRPSGYSAPPALPSAASRHPRPR